MSYGISAASTPSASQEPAASASERSTRKAAIHDRLMQWLASHAGELSAEKAWLSRYGMAVGALATATVVRMLLDPILDNRAPYGCYLIAVLFVAWRTGLGPALATVICGTFLARYFFETPRYSLWFDLEANQSSLAMSLTIGLVAAVLCESLRITARENGRLYRLARLADTRKDEFLATLAHELRNPLQPIRSAVYILNGIESQTPQAVELHQVIARQTEHLIRLVNDLLDVSRITQSKIELQFEQVALETIVAGAIDVVRPLIEEKRQELRSSLPPEKFLIRVDGVRLTQIVTNLLHNASKYTGIAGRIWLSVSVEGKDLIVRVRDTGIGIAPEMRKRIFELFEQVPQAVGHSPGGLGIGLTLVRSLVQMHGGTIEANSPGPELGSEFTLRLPAVVVKTMASEASPPTAVSTPRSVANGAPLRVLVVDDSPAVAISLHDTIVQWDHVVETCADGFSALEAVRTFKPDVVLADLGMPRMNGYQLAEELRRLPEMQGVRLIAVSGYGQEGDRQRSREAGFSRHMVKPIKPDELQKILAEHVSQRSKA